MSDTNNNNAQELSFEERINANFGHNRCRCTGKIERCQQEAPQLES